MNIDQLTICEAKQIASMFPMRALETRIPPIFPKRVIAQFIGRFVFICNLEIRGDYCYLTNVLNVRYWTAEGRENGLGDLASKGPVELDKLDAWPDQIIPLRQLGPVMQAGDWSVEKTK